MRGKLFAKRDTADIAKIIISAVCCFAAVSALYVPLKSWAAAGWIQSLVSGIVCGAAGLIVYAAVIFASGESDIRKILKKE